MVPKVISSALFAVVLANGPGLTAFGASSPSPPSPKRPRESRPSSPVRRGREGLGHRVGRVHQGVLNRPRSVKGVPCGAWRREAQASRAVMVSRTGTDRTVVTKIESRARVVERSYRVA